MRTPLVLLLLAATLVVFGKILLVSEPIEQPRPAVILPAEPPLPEWQLQPEPPIPALPHTSRYQRRHGGLAIDLELQFIPDLPVHYVYNPLLELRFLPRGHLPLDAGLRFYVSSRDRVISNLRADAPTDSFIERRQLDSASAYGLWTADHRLHLSAIVTPNGVSGIATRRVARSVYLDPLTPRLLGNWLLGRASLPDTRCVLVHFSIPEEASGEAANRRVLEQAWADWHRAWRPTFRG